MLKVKLYELEMRKTAREAFSATMEYPRNIMEDWFRRLDTESFPVQVGCFPVES